MSTTKGRQSPPNYQNTVNPGSAEQGVLVKQDEMIDTINQLVVAIKALTAKLDADAGVTDVDYASTLTDDISATEITKVDLK